MSLAAPPESVTTTMVLIFICSAAGDRSPGDSVCRNFRVLDRSHQLESVVLAGFDLADNSRHRFGRFNRVVADGGFA